MKPQKQTNDNLHRTKRDRLKVALRRFWPQIRSRGHKCFVMNPRTGVEQKTSVELK